MLLTISKCFSTKLLLAVDFTVFFKSQAALRPHCSEETRISYLAHVLDAVIVVDGTVLATEADGALARVVVVVVLARRPVLARIELFGAELDLLVAVNTYTRANHITCSVKDEQ